MAELVGLTTASTELEELEHLKVATDAAVDGQGSIICQSAIRLRMVDGDATLAAPLDLTLRMTEAAIEPLFSGAAWAGTVLWRAAARLIETALLAPATRIPLEGRTVVELGCGLGAPGFVAARLGASKAVLTDQASLVALLETNTARNFAGEAPSVAVGEFFWSTAGATKLRDDHCGGSHFDVILCCDCVYEPLYGDCWIQLLEAIDVLAGPDSDVLISLERRSETHNHWSDGVDPFLEGMAKNGFRDTRMDSVEPVEIHHFRRGPPPSGAP